MKSLKLLVLFGILGLAGCASTPDEQVVTLPLYGPLQVGAVSGGPVHLLVGGESELINGFEVSPDGRWIVTWGQSETIRLWPMPDLSKPPLHTLPPKELVEKLKTLTNLRVVADEESNTGWRLDIDPFPGWEEVPSW